MMRSDEEQNEGKEGLLYTFEVVFRRCVIEAQCRLDGELGPDRGGDPKVDPGA